MSELPDQARLAYPRLPDERDDLAMACSGALESLGERL